MSPVKKPKEVLNSADYENYRNVRAVSVLFVLLGGVLVLGGIGIAVQKNPSPDNEIPPWAGIGIAVAGLAGAIGGVAALRGNRRFAPLVYVMAALYVLVCPIGTILSFVLLTGLSRYLDSVDRVTGASPRATPGDG